MASFNKFQQFVEDLAKQVHDLSSDTFKVVLTAAANAPVNTNTVLANLTEIADGNGYTSPGLTAGAAGAEQTAGTLKFTLATDPVWTATGGSMAAFRYAVLYNDSSASDSLVGWWDYGSDLTLAVGETFTLNLDQAAGVLTLA